MALNEAFCRVGNHDRSSVESAKLAPLGVFKSTKNVITVQMEWKLRGKIQQTEETKRTKDIRNRICFTKRKRTYKQILHFEKICIILIIDVINIYKGF